MSVEVKWAGSPLSSARPSLSSNPPAPYSPLPSPMHGSKQASKAQSTSSPSSSAVPPAAAVSAATLAARELELLSVEEAKVRAVQESMVQCQQLTDGMLAILEQFDKKLAALETSMQPLHRGTVQLINAHKSQK